MTQCSNNQTSLFNLTLRNFGHWKFGYYLEFGAWSLVIWPIRLRVEVNQSLFL
jgi:hypothetical protein